MYFVKRERNRLRILYDDYPRQFWVLVLGTFVVQVAGALWYEQEPPEETPTPTAVPTWIVPPSPTPRVILETPIGSSSIGFIQQQATLVIGWVGPALFSTLFAAFAWATGVFNWLWSLATWLFSGAWRGGGEV